MNNIQERTAQAERMTRLGEFIRVFLVQQGKRTDTIEVPPKGSPERLVRRIAYEVYAILVEELEPSSRDAQRLADQAFSFAETIQVGAAALLRRGG